MKYKNINLVIPMAGKGSRFSNAGYTDPKPFIPFLGKAMIEHVIDAFPPMPDFNVNFIFIVLKEHDVAYNASAMLKAKWPDCKVVLLDEVTEGAACTILKAEHLIDNDSIMAIMNSDNIIHFNGNLVNDLLLDESVDGVILTFEEESDPKWSFAKLDDRGYVMEVAEKKAISTHATAGLYFWSKGSNFVSAAKSMIAKNFRVNNEFYVAPVYNENAEAGERVVICEVNEMNGVGTPEDLQAYIAKISGA
jgi:dTDP-glucose pyrophosphorylase